jgi:hypothetical protein
MTAVVIRRQINYSLLKEPGRNHDQVVYLNSPEGFTNEGIHRLRTGWKQFNPNIIDVMGVSQLPDRISSKEINSPFYSLLVDPGSNEFFLFKLLEGNWFKANAGDSIFVTNKKGRKLLWHDTSNLIGVIQDFSGQFNLPEKPLKIKLGPDYNYNWLCVRILEVDIRRTVDRLSSDFAAYGVKPEVKFLDKNFEAWILYQDRLNVLSAILAVIAAVLSCCAVYGLSISLVRDKLKQIAVHKLYGAHIIDITVLLVKDFTKQMLLSILVFGPITYIFLIELLRIFVHSTKLNWIDPLYPVIYCAFVIVALSAFQALSLNRSNLTSALKG